MAADYLLLLCSQKGKLKYWFTSLVGLTARQAADNNSGVSGVKAPSKEVQVSYTAKFMTLSFSSESALNRAVRSLLLRSQILQLPRFHRLIVMEMCQV